MKPIYFIFSAILLTVCLSVFPQRTTRVNAVKANNYGVIYTLPKTSFEITFLVKKTTQNRGDFYQYAQRYLGIENPITENKIIFSMEDISLINKGIVDKENSFMIEFRSNTLEPFVYLREDGVIAAVNTEPEKMNVQQSTLPESKLASVNPRRYFTQETLMAGSLAKQAELVSRQIFDLRLSRQDILTGEAENMPPDGHAYKVVMDEINVQEKVLTEFFSGSETTEYFTQTITIIPDNKDINQSVISRFSEKLGLVDSDNLAGDPIYLSLKNKAPKEETQLSEKELKQWEKKLSEGLVYNIPGKAELVIEYKNKRVKSIETDVVQYGSQDVLTKKMFDNMKQPIKILFYPELGAIKQIIQ